MNGELEFDVRDRAERSGLDYEDFSPFAEDTLWPRSIRAGQDHPQSETGYCRLYR